MKIFHVVSWNKSVVYLLLFNKGMHAFSIYLHYFTNDLSKQFLVFAGKQLRKCLAYLTDKTKSWLMWEINGISEQDALSKFTMAMCVRVRVPSKKKTRGILSIKLILDRIRWGAPFIIMRMYQSLFEINCHRASRLSGLSGR